MCRCHVCSGPSLQLRDLYAATPRASASGREIPDDLRRARYEDRIYPRTPLQDFQPNLVVHTDLRAELGLASLREEMWAVARKLKERLTQEANALRLSGEAFEGRVDEQGLSTLPHWLAQPYFRQPMPEQTKKKGENGAPVKRDADNSAQANDDGTTSVTGDEDAGKAKKKTKKTRVIPNLYQSAGCRNMYSAACVHQRCKGCCRGHQQDINVFDCATHQIRSLQHQQNVTTSDSQQTIEATVLEAHVKNLNPVEAVSGAIASDTSADKAEQSIAA